MSVAGVGYTAYTSYMPGSRSEASAPAFPVMQNPASSAPTGLFPRAFAGENSRSATLMFLNRDGDSAELSLPARQSYPAVAQATIPMQGTPTAQQLPGMPVNQPLPAVPGMPNITADAEMDPKSLIPEMPGSGLLDSLKPEGECQTCANRKYVDGSDDPSVSYQTPTNISPNMSAAAVAVHEQEHVRNEQANAQREGRQVVSQTVSLQYDCCPECGKSYVSGGTTRTMTTGKKELPEVGVKTQQNQPSAETE